MNRNAVQQFTERGFVVIPVPCSGKQMAELATAYDNVMALASGPNVKEGSTTLRMSDMLNHGPAFDDIFLYPPLLEICRSATDEPFKLSSRLARTLKPHSPAQRLHADLPRDCPDVPLVGFILMIDPVRGAKRRNSLCHHLPKLAGCPSRTSQYGAVPSRRSFGLRRSRFPHRLQRSGLAWSHSK